jgi:hypothetical protein
VVEQLLKMKMSKFIPGIMTRENIVDNVFILYGDQIGMIKYSLAFHKYTITNRWNIPREKEILSVRMSRKVLYKTLMS